MSLTPVPSANALLSQPAGLRAALVELQGTHVEVINGAAAGTKMDVAALRVEDTLIQAIVLADTWAAPTSDLANITIQPTKASGTLTVGGNPTAGQTFVVNGNTYTWRAVPTMMNEVKITAGANNTMAAAVAAAINAYESRYESAFNGDSSHTAGVTAVAVNAVVTITSVADGVGNAPQVTGTVTTLAAAGTNTGSATFTPATSIATDTVVVNGVTFTQIGADPTEVQFLTKATNVLQGAELARAINHYEYKYRTLNVRAEADITTGVVSIFPFAAPTGNAISLTEGASNFAASGTGYLAGGTNTGGIKSTTDLSLATLLLYWTNKR